MSMFFRAACPYMVSVASNDQHYEGADKTSLLQTVRTFSQSATKLWYVPDPHAQALPDMQTSTTDDMLEMNISTPIGDSMKLFGYPSSADIHVSGSVLREGSWETELVNDIYKIFHENNFAGHFLDVGGNIGTYTIPLGHAFRGQSDVFVVEGMPSIASHLKKGVLENGLDNVHLYEYALAGPVSENSLDMSLNPTNKGGSAVTGNKEWTTSDDDIQKFSVPLTTLNAMQKETPELGYILVAKMDIEGNEGQALLGATEFLASPPCYLFIELQPEWLSRADTPIESVIKQLEDSDYDTSAIDPTTANTYKLQQRKMQACVNRLAMHKLQDSMHKLKD